MGVARLVFWSNKSRPALLVKHNMVFDDQDSLLEIVLVIGRLDALILKLTTKTRDRPSSTVEQVQSIPYADLHSP